MPRPGTIIVTNDPDMLTPDMLEALEALAAEFGPCPDAPSVDDLEALLARLTGE
jgi:hypothetical protein